MSHGFRPGRGCRDALREVDQLIKEGYTFVVDADLESYFDTIPHERLMQRVEERISDGRVLGLLRSWLGQEIMRGMERWEATEGTPQGAVISPLLSNIYLHPLDELMAACGYRMVRYADDFVVLCKSREEAEAALVRIRAWVKDNGLRLHPDKTHIGDCRNRGEGFEFLGYRFEAGGRFVRKKSSTVSKIVSGPRPGARAAKASRALSEASTRCFEDGSTTSNTRTPEPSRPSTSSYDDGCVQSCASRRSDPASAQRTATISNGLMHSSQKQDCSQ
jgi:group II intron reverse transcriptase/maturase